MLLLMNTQMSTETSFGTAWTTKHIPVVEEMRKEEWAKIPATVHVNKTN